MMMRMVIIVVGAVVHDPALDRHARSRLGAEPCPRGTIIDDDLMRSMLSIGRTNSDSRGRNVKHCKAYSLVAGSKRVKGLEQRPEHGR